MPRKTSFDELYTSLGNLVTRASGRPYWRKAGIQSRPNTPYALVHLVEAISNEKQIVENVLLDEPTESGEWYQQTPWGTSQIDVRIEFYLNRNNDSVLQAAKRVELSLFLEERFWDLWGICSLSGGVRIIDLSTIFREDIEPRSEIRFSLLANIAEPLPLEDENLFDINSQQVNVTHVAIDDVESTHIVTIEDDES